MSSYLTFYGKLRKEDKYISLFSSSRSSTLYQSFNKNLNLPFCDKTKFILNSSDISNVINDLTNDNNLYLSKINRLLKYKKDSDIEEISELEEIIQENNETISNCYLLMRIVDNCKYSDDDFEYITCDID